MPRRKPFSNKQKKLQLQEKRLRKSQKGTWCIPIFCHACCNPSGTHERDDSASDDHASLHSDPSPQEGGPVELVKLNSQPLPLNAWLEEVANNRNRFCLHFEKETNAEIEHRKHLAKTTPILPIPEVCEVVHSKRMNQSQDHSSSVQPLLLRYTNRDVINPFPIHLSSMYFVVKPLYSGCLGMNLSGHSLHPTPLYPPSIPHLSPSSLCRSRWR